jgi:hypothetical protein
MERCSRGSAARSIRFALRPKRPDQAADAGVSVAFGQAAAGTAMTERQALVLTSLQWAEYGAKARLPGAHSMTGLRS